MNRQGVSLDTPLFYNGDMLSGIFQNPILMSGLCAWTLAQILKTLVNAHVTGSMDIKRLLGDGGMPSGHSATVTAAATAACMIYGPESFEFAITVLLAIIVMHDAMGVRRETGKQAKVLNDITKQLEDLMNIQWETVELKELVGHTPLQVGAGIVLGLITGLLVCGSMI